MTRLVLSQTFVVSICCSDPHRIESMSESSRALASPSDAIAQPQRPSSSPSYAFLVHSQDTLKHTLPPEVDNASIARQKRRRTSPEDQAILEAEYLKDPKPDKAARKAIADRVRGMGDKEVQVRNPSHPWVN